MFQSWKGWNESTLRGPEHMSERSLGSNGPTCPRRPTRPSLPRFRRFRGLDSSTLEVLKFRNEKQKQTVGQMAEDLRILPFGSSLIFGNNSDVISYTAFESRSSCLESNTNSTPGFKKSAETVKKVKKSEKS